jgi:alkylated DNA nucleotide flippase Atl1
MCSRNAARAAGIALFALVSLAVAPGALGDARAPDGAATAAIAQRFARLDQTLEYHFMLTAPPFTEANKEQALASLIQALKPIVEVGSITGPKEGAYLDTRERILDRSSLILRLRPGLVTVKARSTSLASLLDLRKCDAIKYEEDYFEEVGYSISSDLQFKKSDWLAEPTKASVGETLAFIRSKCPDLAAQLDPVFSPIASLKPPGTARMFQAEIKLVTPLAAPIKESGFNAWLFPGATHTLVELAWTGFVKDKPLLDQYYYSVREKLDRAGLLALDQSSKTEQYFFAYYGATALDKRYGALARPAYVKHFEADPGGRIVASPYQQVGTPSFPAFLDPSLAPYDWVIDADGNLAVVPETMHPYGRVYEKGFIRPEDKSQKKPGTGEHYGHLAAIVGLPGRISGELNYDKATNTWSINNKSGRYSKNNPDRTPEQLEAAAKRIRELADIGDARWGELIFILEFGPTSLQPVLEKNPNLRYEDPEKKKRPFVVLAPAAGA